MMEIHNSIWCAIVHYCAAATNTVRFHKILLLPILCEILLPWVSQTTLRNARGRVGRCVICWLLSSDSSRLIVISRPLLMNRRNVCELEMPRDLGNIRT